MELKGKIDFLCVFSVERCNPNGDPTMENRPRIDMDGFGEVTPECIKRKIRNRLQDLGTKIFVQSNDRADDGLQSLKERAESCEELKKELANKKKADKERCAETACREWLDVRAFGQVLAWKGEGKGDGVSIGIKGPVSVSFARSLSPIEIREVAITKSTNLEPAEGKDKATFGIRSIASRGAYVFTGGISPQLAEKTGFTQEDAELLKEALRTMFENDASSARPEGSMTLEKMFWWESPNKQSVVSPRKLFDSIGVESAESYPYFKITGKNEYNAEIVEV